MSEPTEFDALVRGKATAVSDAIATMESDLLMQVFFVLCHRLRLLRLEDLEIHILACAPGADKQRAGLATLKVVRKALQGIEARIQEEMRSDASGGQS